VEDYPIGTCTLPDGSTHTAYQDPEGKQYILGEDGRRAYGDWLLLEEGPPDAGETPDDG
jgi:hypothetical protein